MARYRVKTPLQLPKEIKNLAGVPYPIDACYWLYVYTEQNVKGFCKRFNFKLREVQEIVTMGEWDKKKDEFKERRYRTMAKNRLEAIELTQDILAEIEQLDNAAIVEQVEDFKDEVKQNGGSFILRDKDGNVTRDSFGAAMTRRLPSGIKRTIAENMELREANVKTLVAANTTLQIPLPPSNEPSKQIEGKVIDLTADEEEKPSERDED